MMPSIRSRQAAITTAAKTRSPLLTERTLLALGADPAFIGDLLGDLSEEYAHRAERDGIFAAKWWYAREMVRSTPHVIWNAMRHGTPRARARLAAGMLAVVVSLSVLTIAWLARNGPPARLVVGAGSDSNGIVVNNLEAVQLSMRVLDAAGHRLQRTDVRYRQVSGAPIPVSPRGAIKCTRRGDVIVRASLATLTRDFVVHCEPVRKIREAGWGNFVVGDPAATLTVDAIGLDGEPVTRIAARLRVFDSTVATLDSSGRLRPLRPGYTSVDMEIGDRVVRAEVMVFEPVRTFEGLRPDQRLVVAPVRITRGASIRSPLPTGVFYLWFSADSSEAPPMRGFVGLGSGSSTNVQSPINLSVAGLIICTPMPQPQPGVLGAWCRARAPGAALILTYSGPAGPNEIVGSLALERQEQH
ncbi:MAG TPA: hypothetical protein VK544_10810 [Gemmatimonadaceae bacterium]|nr:hypothetical protein [Gemmatimonadaceae bacterium]